MKSGKKKCFGPIGTGDDRLVETLHSDSDLRIGVSTLGNERGEKNREFQIGEDVTTITNKQKKRLITNQLGQQIVEKLQQQLDRVRIAVHQQRHAALLQHNVQIRDDCADIRDHQVIQHVQNRLSRSVQLRIHFIYPRNRDYIAAFLAQLTQIQAIHVPFPVGFFALQLRLALHSIEFDGSTGYDRKIDAFDTLKIDDRSDGGFKYDPPNDVSMLRRCVDTRGIGFGIDDFALL